MGISKNVKVNVPKRSGFDKTHRNSGTLTCGTITPLLCDEVIPNSRVSLRVNLASQLPPLASDTYMNLKLKTEAFFVPSRLLCKSFEDFFCDNSPKEVSYNGSTILDIVPRIPYIDKAGYDPSWLGPGTLADYLGIKEIGTAGYVDLNILPFVAYHLVWQEWYRNPRVQRPAFIPSLYPGAYFDRVRSIPDCYFGTSASSGSGTVATLNPVFSFAQASESSLNDGKSLFSLRQRNFGFDFFTSARVSAQQGPAVSLTLPVSGQVSGATNVTGTGSFTIAALRAANSLQQFRERNNIPSDRLVDQVKARFGAILSDGVAQRPICIGSATYDVNSTGVSQTAEGSGTGSSANPFDSVSAQYGRAYASGSDFIINDFTANEPGYILVNVTLVPEVSYYTGLDRMFMRYTAAGSITDMANPLLQNVGDQPILQCEVAGNSGTYWNHVFGYTDRYGDWMIKQNQIHGLMRSGQSLAPFVLQRGFSGASPLEQSSAFLEIPKTYLDQCFAVSSAVSGLSAWYDAMLDYKVSMPLSEYSIPSLQDPAYEHGNTISLRRNGQIF